MKANELKTEILFLRQALAAKRMRDSLPEERIVPAVVIHAHACKHCDTTWSCHCGEGNKQDYWIKRHGCEEQQAYSREMARIMQLESEMARLRAILKAGGQNG